MRTNQISKRCQIFALVAILILTGTSCNTLSQTRIEERRVVESDQFSLRITKSAFDVATINARSQYRIETSQKDMVWKEVYQWVQDDPWPVENIQVEIVTANIGVFFNMVTYGVTLDSGESWTFFDFYKASKSDDVVKPYGGETPEIRIGKDGLGEIFYSNRQARNSKMRAIYRTTDYGRTWHPIN